MFLVAWLFLPMPTLTHVVVISGIMVLMIANCLFRYFRQQKG